MGDQVNFTQTLAPTSTLAQVIAWLNNFAQAVMGASSRNLIQNVNASGAALSSIDNAVANQIPIFTGPTTVSLISAGSLGGTRAQRLVTSSPIVVAGGDAIINVSISSGSPTCTLPAAASRSGSAITFKDVGGFFSSNPLTITTTGGETIDGLASVVLGNNRQAATLVPANDGTSTGWFIE